jgi:tetratricopeptide (TPR) repeat protein
MSTNDRDNREQLEQESQQRPGTLKSKLGITIVIAVLVLVAGLLFYRNLKNKSKINELYQEARQAEILENYDEAVNRYQEILKINPLDTAAYYYMGLAFYYKKDYQQALESLKKLVEINPKDNLAYYNIGHILYVQGKYDQAIENYRKSLRFKPNEVLPYLGIGTALFAQGKYDEVIECYRKCLSIDPHYIPAKANISEAYLVTGRFEKAFETANELLKEKGLSTSGKIGVRFTIIASLIFQGKDAEAGEAFQRFTEYYYSVNQEYERVWLYRDIKKFINQNMTLKENKRTLLLKLIDILESPKAEGDKKLKDLETWLKKTKEGKD